MATFPRWLYHLKQLAGTLLPLLVDAFLMSVSVYAPPRHSRQETSSYASSLRSTANSTPRLGVRPKPFVSSWSGSVVGSTGARCW